MASLQNSRPVQASTPRRNRDGPHPQVLGLQLVDDGVHVLVRHAEQHQPLLGGGRDPAVAVPLGEVGDPLQLQSRWSGRPAARTPM